MSGSGDRQHDAFQDAGYGSIPRIGFGDSPAIVVVDFQRGFTDPGFALGRLPLVHEAVEQTAVLLHEARRLKVPVAKSYTAYHSRADMQWWKVKPVIETFLYGHPSTELDPRIHDPNYDFTFCKGAPSAFFNSPLNTYLCRQRVDTVLITGCTTSGCVRATIVDAFSHGYRVAVVEDCTGDGEELAHRVNLEDCARRYADITSSEEVIQYLRALRKA